MRIAIVRRAPNVSFSMDVYADGLVSGLKSARSDWDIVEIRPHISTGQHTSAVGRFIQKASKYYERYWRYPKRLKFYDADILHVIDHSDAHLAYWLKSSPIPTVVTCHDLINLLQPENASHQASFPGVSSALWRYSVKGLNVADHVIAVSSHTAKDARELLQISSRHLSVVPNAAESVFRLLPANEYSSVYSQFSILQDRFCLLNVGSNQPRKNIETILRSLAQLVDRQEKEPVGRSVHFIKAGGAFTHEQKAQIKQYGLQPYITHIDNPDKSTLVKLYNAADVLVAPSLYEGFGITILEAMACGTPVITSNVSSLPEVAGDAAILVNPSSAEEIVTAVRSLQLNPSLSKDFTKRGLERSKTFTWMRSAEQIARVYEALLNKPQKQTK